MPAPHPLSRRDFLFRSTAALAAARLAPVALGASMSAPAEPIIDIHQHTNYGGLRDAAFRQIALARSHAQLIAHQRGMGATTTILLPSGRPLVRPSTLNGKANGLDSTVTSNDDCLTLVRQFPDTFLFGANEVSDTDDAVSVVEKYLNLGAVLIGEQKFGVECDSPAMQRLYALAQAHRVPILMHWQVGSYNHGYDRFHLMLKKFPTVNFIGHAQTFWANIDAKCDNDPRKLYPTGKVTPGGLTDRYLADYPNFFGDLSAGSGENAFKRDPDHARAFLARHQEKLLFGSDCLDPTGDVAVCSGARQLVQIRAYAPDKAAERKMLFGNAHRLFRL